jgi:DNA adenine methylase
MATKPRLNSPIKWYGGKGPIAQWIVRNFPPRESFRRYGEAFGGGASVLLNIDPPCEVEAYNDIHCGLVNLFRVLQHHPKKFQRLLSLIPYAQIEFDDAKVGKYKKEIWRAIEDYIVWRQSFGAMGKTWAKTITRSRRGMADNVSAWLSSIDENLPLVIERLRQVQVNQENALDFIANFDGPDSLIYCDPPYVHSTRGSNNNYQHEMSDAQHAQLSVLLNNCKGKILLSGYRCDLYDKLYEGWECMELETNNKQSGRKVVECLWRNY